MAGRLSFDYDLKSRGHSLVDLRAGLGGEIKALVEDGQFPLQGLDLLSGDLLGWVTSWMGKNEQTPVPCAVVHTARPRSVPPAIPYPADPRAVRWWRSGKSWTTRWT